MPIPRFLTPLLDRFTRPAAPLIDLERMQFIAARPAHSGQLGPVLPPFPDFYKLMDCRQLADTGKAQLFVGRDPEGLQKVIKFCRFPRSPEEDSPRAEEMANALKMSFSEAYSLPVDRVASICQHPLDAATYGFAYQMPFCIHGSLADHAAHGFASQHEAVAVAMATLIPLLLLNDQGGAHGDIKPSNILYWGGENASSRTQEGLRLVLADFGASIDLRHRAGTERDLRRGTFRYCAPEALAGALPTHADDIWAWATTVIELFLPAALRDQRTENHRPIKLDDVPKGAMPDWLASTLQRCRDQTPRDRPSADVVLASFLEHWEVVREQGVSQRARGKPALVNPLIDTEVSMRRSTGTRLYVNSGIDIEIATAGQLLMSGADSGTQKAIDLLYKALVDDGAERCLLDQFLDNMWLPVYSRTAKENAHKIYLPVPNSSLREGVQLYLNALIANVHGHFDKSTLETLEQLANRMHGARCGEQVQALGPDLVYAFATINRPELATDALDLLNDQQHTSQTMLRARAYAFMARGAFIDAVNHFGLALRVSDGEVEIRQIIEYAILAAACGGRLGTLAAGVEEMMQSPTYKMATETLQFHLAAAYLAGDEGLSVLHAQAQILKSGAFMSRATTIAELWLASACLLRLGEPALAVRCASAALHDPRSLLGTQTAFRAALESVQGGTALIPESSANETIPLAVARAAASAGNLEQALSGFIALLKDTELSAATLVEIAKEASELFDRHKRHHEELQVYAQLFSSLERCACTGAERAAMRLAVNELATLKQLGRWDDLVALAACRSVFFASFSTEANGPEAARFEWYLCHGFEELGRYPEVVTQCDRVISLCRRWETEETRAILQQALRYRGATLSQLGREEEEAHTYLQYFELLALDPTDQEDASSRIEVRLLLVLLLLRQGRREEALTHIVAAQEEFAAVPAGLTSRAVESMSSMQALLKTLMQESHGR
ncbi:protein kinase [Duganella sp. FT3S]|uniref:Protein kinase n=1 Tax=Rugamonas fusca TaxID=2758568 RepID=A0A7W2EK31_9BURK|nr:protein kinase [Rugamonas fusca]MBA5607387.1 protein kinase [Rugamonas fusca]